jgi:hypothetical protein
VSPGQHINNFKLSGGTRYGTNVWTYTGANVFRQGRMEDLTDHPTVKPKNLIADAILDLAGAYRRAWGAGFAKGISFVLGKPAFVSGGRMTEAM